MHYEVPNAESKIKLILLNFQQLFRVESRLFTHTHVPKGFGWINNWNNEAIYSVSRFVHKTVQITE